MKVYVVFSGQYSDRDAVAVYSDRDAALEHAWAAGDMEEFELADKYDGPVVERPGKRLFHVRMGRDGNGAQAWEQWELPWRNDVGSLYFSPHQSAVTTHCWARDEDHAIKIANERRTGWLAGGARVGGEFANSWLECVF